MQLFPRQEFYNDRLTDVETGSDLWTVRSIQSLLLSDCAVSCDPSLTDPQPSNCAFSLLELLD